MRFLFLLILLSACASHKSANKLSAFKTDGCSLYPDGVPIVEPNKWLHCCIAHDISYWAGGSLKAKNLADHELGRCVAEKSSVNAKMMYSGVHMGGLANGVLPWAWGFGWKENLGYKKLTESELGQVEERQNTMLRGISVYEDVLTEQQLKYVLERLEVFRTTVKSLNTP